MTGALTTIAPAAHDRRKYIGGSDIAAILGISPWKTALDLWIDKTTPPREDGSNAAAKRRGTRLEPYIIDMIEAEHGMPIAQRNRRYIDPIVPIFAAEIDAENTAGENVEIKTVHPFKAREWGEEGGDALPIHYVAQTQWGLGITGRDRCHVFALIGDDLRRYVVDRDDETIDAMRTRASEFWERYVVPALRPPVDYNHSKAQASLRRLYPGTDGSVVEATAMHEHWRAVLTAAEEQRDRYQGVIDGARAHLLAEMGTASRLVFADGKEFQRKLVTKEARTIEYPAVKYINLRLVNTKE